MEALVIYVFLFQGAISELELESPITPGGDAPDFPVNGAHINIGLNAISGETGEGIIHPPVSEELMGAVGGAAPSQHDSSGNNTGLDRADVIEKAEWIRSISMEMAEAAEEARAHRMISRLTWGALASLVLAVGLALLWKWKPKN